MSSKNYGDEGTCGYSECIQEPEWHRLTDDIGPGRVFVCSDHRRIEEGGGRALAFAPTAAKYTRVDREPAESHAVIAHLLKVVARG